MTIVALQTSPKLNASSRIYSDVPRVQQEMRENSIANADASGATNPDVLVTFVSCFWCARFITCSLIFSTHDVEIQNGTHHQTDSSADVAH